VILFVLGFSMEDEHIREITIRSANSNPTLKIYIFCHSNDSDSKMKEKMQIEKLRYSNIEIIGPDADELTVEKINEDLFKEILNSMSHEK